MKKIMILGAGIYQVPLIQKAKEMGLFTVVASIPGPYPGFALADECLYLDTRDQEALLAAAAERKIQGICTTGTDVAVRSLGYVNDALGLHGLSYAAGKIVTDKYLFRETLKEKGVSGGIPFFRIFTFPETLEAFEKLGGPVMIKAVDSSGSRGITRVDTVSELKSAFDAAFHVTKLPYVLMEKYIEGHEIGVDGFVADGKIRLLIPHEKFVVSAGHTTLPGGHAFPYAASQKLLKSIESAVSLAVHAAGLDNCAFNTDVIVLDDEAYLLELGGRCGATCIPELISIHCGLDYYRIILENALGLTPDFTVKSSLPCMAKLLFSPVDGIITDIDKPLLASVEKQAFSVSLDYPIGAHIEGVKNGTDRIGQLIVKTDSEEELDRLLQLCCQAIRLDGVPLSCRTVRNH